MKNIKRSIKALKNGIYGIKKIKIKKKYEKMCRKKQEKIDIKKIKGKRKN